MKSHIISVVIVLERTLKRKNYNVLENNDGTE